jgi:hypothetical protein
MQKVDTLIQELQTETGYQTTIVQLPIERPVYLILDGARFDALNLVFSSGQSFEFNMLYHGTELKDQLKISPIIVRYDNFLKSQYHKWFQNAVAFTTTTNLIDTANHLKSLIYCEMPNLQPAFFRFYSPNWLIPLITGQTVESLFEFTGPIDNWYVPENDGVLWHQFTITKQTASKAVSDEAWFKLTENLQEKLAEYGYQQFIDQLTQRYTDLSMDTEEGQQFRSVIKRNIEQAKSYTLDRQDHITQYVDLALCYTSNIEDDRALEILTNPYDTPTNRLDALIQYLRDPDVELIVSNEDNAITQKTSEYPTSL